MGTKSGRLKTGGETLSIVFSTRCDGGTPCSIFDFEVMSFFWRDCVA